MRDKIIWRQIQIRSSETLLELSLTWLDSRWNEAAVDNSLDTARCLKNFWTNLSCKPQNCNIRSQKGKMKPQKNSSSFHHRNCKNEKINSAKIDFYVFLHFLWNCCFAVVCCRCKWQERKTHLNPLFFLLLRLSGFGQSFPLIEKGDDAMRENVSGWNEEPTKVSFAIEMENVKSF